MYDKKERWIRNNKESIKLESVQTKYEPHYPADENYPDQKDALQLYNNQHILIVDDNPELRSFLHQSLSAYYIISEAEDGYNGLAKAKEESPDLIMSDVMMPGMNGIEFCRMIKEDIETSHIPFLILTAKERLDSQIEGIKSGADYYFAKPLSLDVLLPTIRNIFYQKQKLKERFIKNQHAEAKELVHSAKDKQFIDELLCLIESQVTNPEMNVEYICVVT